VDQEVVVKKTGFFSR